MWGETIRLALKPFRDMFVFSCSSRRTEVLAFTLLSVLANAATIEIYRGTTEVAAPLHTAWMLLWQYPLIALFVRRLHDQGRSARWAWAIGAGMAALLASAMLLPQAHDGSYTVTIFAWKFHPVGPLAIIHGIAMALVILALFGLTFAPEQPSTNRYGPDPRLDPGDFDELAAH